MHFPEIIMTVIDCSVHSTPYIPCLGPKGVTCVMRYYASAKQDGLGEKILEPDEAKALSKAGISVGAVYQYNANVLGSFSQAQGKRDGKFARKYAALTIGQPKGSAIYFGVDFDVVPDPAHDKTHDIENVIAPHFRGIAEAMAEPQDYTSYDTGVYSSWNVCDYLFRNKLVKYTWLSQSTSFGTKALRDKYVQSRAWNLSQGMPRSDLCGNLPFDANEVTNPSFGQFKVPFE
jgi:hypothetical protein